MIRTQVYIPDDLHRDLTLLAATSKKNISELLREGAREVLKKDITVLTKRKKVWGKGFIGACKAKVKTNAVDVFHEYYEKYAI
ncbi:MAG: CopG family transcriptional regulator [Patescibacteria group bacterium]